MDIKHPGGKARNIDTTKIDPIQAGPTEGYMKR